MIDPDKRKAIFQLHTEGMSLREISRRLHVSRKTVRKIIQQQGEMPDTVRKDKKEIDPDLLRRLYHECRGWAERVHERLQEEEDIEIGYSTLTRMLRDLGLGKSPAARCDRVPDEPGAEMQHDTSDYRRAAGRPAGRKSSPACSILRYCEATLPEVLPRLQPLRHEVFSARGVDVLGAQCAGNALSTTPTWRACGARESER